MPVYVIRAGETDNVKLGWANDPERRRLELQTAHYEELRIIRVIDGRPTAEGWLHSHFRAQWIRGEWFRFCQEMLEIQPHALRQSSLCLAVARFAHNARPPFPPSRMRKVCWRRPFVSGSVVALCWQALGLSVCVLASIDPSLCRPQRDAGGVQGVAQSGQETGHV